MPYKLSATLISHTSDVRALNSPNNDLVLSASRDTTAIAWQRTAPAQFQAESVLKASSRYVNAVAYIPPSPDTPKGYVVTGGQDTSINIFSLDNPKEDPDFVLLGHNENVCALDVSPGRAIISGSWDSTAKVWKNFQLAHDLKGHQYSVWAVLALDESQYLTGSADKTIKLWKEQKNIQTFTGHTDAVRGLCTIPDIGFASCSNDSEIRVWTLGGDVIYTLSGHTSFVYSLSMLPNGDIVSSGEDRSVRIWQDGECSQVIVHPAISVWAVSTMPNGDIVSGSSDGVIRIFSSSEDRWAAAEQIKEYEEKVASQALPAQQVGDIKKDELPGLEALAQPGNKSGEVKMIRNGAIVEAHQWDTLSRSWKKIGDVVDAVGQGRKQLYQGKEYDYVFDVDIQDGVPPLKLPFNVTDNPFAAAQKFLETNDLPLTYIDEVVRFIEKNTSGVNIGAASEDYVDPYTGASRYRTPASVAAPLTGYSDPFTGASRYVAGPAAQANTSDPSSYADPFTGASRYIGTPQTSAPTRSTPPLKILPLREPFFFKQANVTAMQGKLKQFNEALKQEISTATLAIFPEEHRAINEVFEYLTVMTVSSSQKPSRSLTSTHTESIISILERWPASQKFPVIDLSRLLVGFAPDALTNSETKARFLSILFTSAEWSAPWTPPLSKYRETNVLLVLRTLANSFQVDTNLTNETWVEQVILGLSQVPYVSMNKAQHVAFVTILYNTSCYGLRTALSGVLTDRLHELISSVLESESADPEVVYRGFVTLGNLLYVHKSKNTDIGAARKTRIQKVTNARLGTLPDVRMQNITKDVLALL